MEKLTLDLSHTFQNMYETLSNEKILKAIDWIDNNANAVGWPFDRLRTLAIQELESRS